MIAIIPDDLPFQFNDEIIIPDNSSDLQNFIETLWNKIYNNNEIDKIDLYNKAAIKYNEQVKFDAVTIINNLKNQKMATKKVAKKAVKKIAKKAVKKSVPQKKSSIVKEKKPSQKSKIVELAEKGKTIDEIAEITGFKKTNVSWYFYKLKLGKSNEHTDKG